MFILFTVESIDPSDGAILFLNGHLLLRQILRTDG